ncbi:MAG: cytochrome c oxidase subunit II [Planctomycetes bacterium]|nr:cytochrome c oxidase subunit II [Planctomycetota bacterium]
MMMLATGNVAQEVDRAFAIIGGMCLVMLVAITGVMVYFAFKYRRSVRREAAQIEGHLPLEVAWIIIPTLLAFYMFFVGMKGFRMMREVPLDARVIEVTGQQWFWKVYYPDEEIFAPVREDNKVELHLPVGKPVKFALTSNMGDVLHSFYLPDFRIKEDCIPGQETYIWINPDKIGRYNIFCAEYCGADHSKMGGELIVEPQEDYDAWVAKMIADKNKPVVMAVAMNEETEEIKNRNGPLLFGTYCATCHDKNGQGGLIEGARNFTSLEGWTKGTRLTDIFRTITEGVPGTQMRSFGHLPAWDRFALAHQVASFYKGKDRPLDTPEDIEKLKEDYTLDKQYEPGERIPIDKAMEAIAKEAEVKVSSL